MNYKFSQKPFWKAKSLHEMSKKEWESLCCRCGICCLNRYHDRKSCKVYFTRIVCRFLDTDTCNCSIYENRFQISSDDCEKITPDNILKLRWLPTTCGYRTVAEGRDLEWWHPLISGDFNTVNQAGISILAHDIVSENDMVVVDLLSCKSSI